MAGPQGLQTHKEVVGVGIWATNLEQLHQVMELAVDVAADCDGAFLCRVSRTIRQHVTLLHLPRAERWTLLEAPREPTTPSESE